MEELFTKVHDVLPIFKIDEAQTTILYSPGYYITLGKIATNEMEQLLINPAAAEDPGIQKSLTTLLQRAGKTVMDRDSIRKAPFSIECLTIHVGSDCKLDCTYCYSRLDKTRNSKLRGFPDVNMIQNIVEYIAENSDAGSKGLSVVFHGAGEPTFHWRQLMGSYDDISATAAKHDMPVFTYLSTNGYLTDDQIDWLSASMDLIGISCDGPPEIQSEQRTRGNEGYPDIERTFQRISGQGGQFEIRTTITKDTFLRQLEIVRYFIDKCHAGNIRFEPVYLAGKDGFTKYQADIFFDNFRMAQRYAEDQGVNLSYAGVRMEELHGSYCDVLRNTLRLTSDGVFRNCFCFMKDNSDNILGGYNMTRSRLELVPGIDQLKIMASTIPDICKTCINVYHCSRACPDFCILNPAQRHGGYPDVFRCRFHQLLTVNNIKKLAGISSKSEL